MPKVTQYPRLRPHVRKGKSGQIYTYWYYDMRPDGQKDILLGSDYDEALRKWDELHNQKPRAVGRIQEAITAWRDNVLVGTIDNPSPYTNADTRRDYTRHLKRIEAWCGEMAWHEMSLPFMRQYLRMRKGKTQANREMSVFSLVWNYGRMEGMTALPWPAAGLERSGWKNEETPREIEIIDAMFDAVHAAGDQILRDAMDIASATSMRVTDVRTIPLPPGDVLNLKASKTGKRLDFTVSLSDVLPDLIRRRRANKQALHLKLLAAPSGREVSYRMLNDRFVAARQLAAETATAAGDKVLAEAVKTMILRDCRRYASNLPETVEEAQRLLQHGNSATTVRHYRTKADKAKPVR